MVMSGFVGRIDIAYDSEDGASTTIAAPSPLPPPACRDLPDVLVPIPLLATVPDAASRSMARIAVTMLQQTSFHDFDDVCMSLAAASSSCSAVSSSGTGSQIIGCWFKTV